MCLAFMTANGGHRLSTLIICVPSEIFITLKLLKPIAYIIFFYSRISAMPRIIASVFSEKPIIILLETCMPINHR